MKTNNGFDITFNFQTIGIIIAALGSIAALISAWVQIAPGKPELEVRITSIEEFSARPEIEGLVGEFTYKGDKINRLITLRATIVNTGNKTIIGKGVQKNIIGSALTIDVPSTLSIVNSTLISNDLNVKLSSNDKAIALSFNQWRPSEILEFLIYMKADDTKITEYLIKKEREIIDGNFKIIDAMTRRIGRNPLIDYMPAGYVKGIKAFGYLSIAIAFPIFFMLAVEVLKTRIQAFHWKNTNTNSFNLFVEEKLQLLSDEEQERLKSDPDLMATIIWKQYDGSRYPKTLGDSGKDALFMGAFLLLLAFGFLPLFIALHFMY